MDMQRVKEIEYLQKWVDGKYVMPKVFAEAVESGIQTIEQQHERLKAYEEMQMNLHGDGVESVDYIQWLQDELARATNQAFQSIDEDLNKSKYMKKPYKFVEKKEIYNNLKIASNDNRKLAEELELRTEEREQYKEWFHNTKDNMVKYYKLTKIYEDALEYYANHPMPLEGGNKARTALEAKHARTD